MDALFIVASPRPATGKTFLARLVADFLRMDGGAVEAFELSPGDSALADLLPDLTASDLDSTQARMGLFDRLIQADGVAKVVDVGHTGVRAVLHADGQIGSPTKRARARSRSSCCSPPTHPTTVKAYADLAAALSGDGARAGVQRRHTQGPQAARQYPFTRAAAVPLQIPLLPPGLKVHAERRAFPSSTSTAVPMRSRSARPSSCAHGPSARSWNSASWNCGCCWRSSGRR